MVNINDNEYYIQGPSHKNDRRTNAELTKQLHRDFKDVLVV